MKSLILSYFSQEEMPYHEWLPEIKDKLILFVNDQVSSSFNPQEYLSTITFENYNYNGNIERTAVSLNKNQPFERILALDEMDLVRAARLRELFSIDGQDVESAITYRDKLIMRQHMKEKGLPIPEFREVSSPIDLLLFIEEHGYPVIIKPRDLVGSIGVSIIRNSNELENWLVYQFQSNMMVEKYIEGGLYHIDGLVNNDEIEICWPSVYYTLNRYWLNNNFHSSYMLHPDNPNFKQLISFANRVISLMPSPRTFTFHLEVFRTFDDELIICEIASRTGWGRVNKTIEYSLGVNLNCSVLRLQCELPVNIEPSLRHLGGWVLCKPQNGKLMSIPSKIPFDFVVDYDAIAKPGMTYKDVERSNDYIAKFIVIADTEVQLRDYIDKSYKWFAKNTEWR